MRTRADSLQDLWTCDQPVCLSAQAVNTSTFPVKAGEVVDVDLPRERNPGSPGLADDVLDLLAIALAVQAFKRAVCIGRRSGMCVWDDHGTGCPVRIAHNLILDAHAAFETRVTEEETS